MKTMEIPSGPHVYVLAGELSGKKYFIQIGIDYYKYCYRVSYCVIFFLPSLEVTVFSYVFFTRHRFLCVRIIPRFFSFSFLPKQRYLFVLFVVLYLLIMCI